MNSENEDKEEPEVKNDKAEIDSDFESSEKNLTFVSRIRSTSVENVSKEDEPKVIHVSTDSETKPEVEAETTPEAILETNPETKLETDLGTKPEIISESTDESEDEGNEGLFV